MTNSPTPLTDLDHLKAALMHLRVIKDPELADLLRRDIDSVSEVAIAIAEGTL